MAKPDPPEATTGASELTLTSLRRFNLLVWLLGLAALLAPSVLDLSAAGRSAAGVLSGFAVLAFLGSSIVGFVLAAKQIRQGTPAMDAAKKTQPSSVSLAGPQALRQPSPSTSPLPTSFAMSLAASDTLLATVQALEVELHHPGVRCSPERLMQLLHPEFHEVGRSGSPYTRETVIRFLAGQAAPPSVDSNHFAVAELAPGVALLTYRSAHVGADQQRSLHTLRSSVWLKTEVGWQLRYHQGTPALETW